MRSACGVGVCGKTTSGGVFVNADASSSCRSEWIVSRLDRFGCFDFADLVVLTGGPSSCSTSSCSLVVLDVLERLDSSLSSDEDDENDEEENDEEDEGEQLEIHKLSSRGACSHTARAEGTELSLSPTGDPILPLLPNADSAELCLLSFPLELLPQDDAGLLHVSESTSGLALPCGGSWCERPSSSSASGSSLIEALRR
jgi:hypothetical protein